MKTQGILFSIFGGTGNLTYNKLIPALYQLYEENKIDEKMAIVAIGRRPKGTDVFRDEVETGVQKKCKSYNKSTYDRFKQNLHYYELDFEQPEGYEALKIYMDGMDELVGANGNRVFYLATSPSFFPSISEHLRDGGLLGTDGFKRAVFEKPFGYNLESAMEINQRITAVFGEDNIYRIDHYLGKEMIQSILAIRFTNQIFKPVWNHESIDNVQITVMESVGVEERGGYYDQSGALRDMIQNHLLQILAIVAMEPPKHFDTMSIRDEKVKVLKSLVIKPDSPEKRTVVFGQYDGYRKEEKVNLNSTTETYVALKCEIDQPRWKGVPFYLRTGKYLNSREAEVIIEFKNDHSYHRFGDTAESNLLVMKIQPEEGIYFRINTKRPRREQELMPVSMDYCQSCNIVYRSPEAYERLLNDIVKGDSTLFTRWDEVETAWILIKGLLEQYGNKADSLVSYEPGSSGPKEADEMLAVDGRKWRNLEDLERAKFNFE